MANEAEGLAQTDAMAVALAVGWVIVTGIFFWMAWPDAVADDGFAGGRLLLVLIAVFVPAMILLVTTRLMREVTNLRQEVARLRAVVAEIADAQAAHSALAKTLAAKAAAEKPAPLSPASELATPAQQVQEQPAAANPQRAEAEPEAPVSQFTSRRAVSRLITPRAAPQAPADQPALALDSAPAPENPPIERPDLIKALNFPDDENDTEGFAALRRALRDLNARKLVQASQDVLTLLSQDGIYMDDLRPAPVSADLWRRFAKGERGKSVDQLGGIRDQAYLSVISRQMREDTIFRDSVHHFLRCFDQLLMHFEKDAADADLLGLAETRTTRAFMILARATGTFD